MLATYDGFVSADGYNMDSLFQCMGTMFPSSAIQETIHNQLQICES